MEQVLPRLYSPFNVEIETAVEAKYAHGFLIKKRRSMFCFWGLIFESISRMEQNVLLKKKT
jgi:hypothetical protein